MTVTKDDLRAAVTTGTITEVQAAAITALSDARRGHRENLGGLNEPFELFRGFNEVFIVVGLMILYGGWSGVTALSTIMSDGGSLRMALLSAVGMAGIAVLARYFTLIRRMVAPSIVLAILFGVSAFQFVAFLLGTSFLSGGGLATTVGLATLLMLVYWAVFRVPFSMFLVGMGVFVTALGLASMGGGDLGHPRDLFLLSAGGPFAILTFVLGVVGLAVALWFDMSDPHRVSLRSQNGFWLHVIAAPAIVNTVALTLFQAEQSLATIGLVAFLAVMALFAIAIDRRSFLISGVGYVVALLFGVVDQSGFALIFILGGGLVLLGAKWENIRRALMHTLPAFPGKDRLPPWEAPVGQSAELA